MKLEIDENLSPMIADSFREAGHDVESVRSQGLLGIKDGRLPPICAEEGRCLVTSDVKFSSPILNPPETHAGMILVGLLHEADVTTHLSIAGQLVKHLPEYGLPGELWTFKRGKLRIYSPESNGSDS